MRYYVLRDTNEPLRCGEGIPIEVYRDGAWRRDPELLGVYSGDEPIRNATKEERKEFERLE